MRARAQRTGELYTDTRIMPDPDRLGVDYDSKEIRIPRNDLIRDRGENGNYHNVTANFK